MYTKMGKNVLAIGAHFDDIELGCGGTLIRHVKAQDNVYGMVLTNSGWLSPKNAAIRSSNDAYQEGLKSFEILGVELLETNRFETCKLIYDDNLICSILDVIEQYKIDTVYSHWVHDCHQDHSAIAKATITACKHVPRLLMYLSNWYNSDEVYAGNFYSDITKEFEKKIGALECYKTEITRTGGHWKRWLESICIVNGLKIGCDYAESFEIVKYLI